MQHLEIIFKDHLHPDDVEIIEPASPDQPGRAKLKQARVNGEGRVLSHNGGGLIGYIADDEPWHPYHETYWLEVSAEAARGPHVELFTTKEKAR